MATAERFEKSVERTVVENVPMVRLELTEEEAKSLIELTALVNGDRSRTYRKYIAEVFESLYSAGVLLSAEYRFRGAPLEAQPLPKEPA